MADPDPTVVPATPPPSDAKPPPILGPILGLLGSQKAIVMLALVGGTLVLVGLGKVPWVDAASFLKVVAPAWFLAHMGQEGMTALAKSRAGE